MNWSFDALDVCRLIQGAAFVLLLSCAAWSDLRTGLIPDRISAGIVLAGFLTKVLSAQWMLHQLIGALAIGGTLLLASMIRKNSFGGGDIKLCAACGFFLGFSHGSAGLFFGLLLAALAFAVRRTKRLPLAPYLGAGFVIAYLLGGL